jgi:26S proteasome regulatory subunit N12
MQAATATLQELRSAWSAGNLSVCGQLLSKMKVALLKIAFLPNSAAAPPKEHLLLAREALEIGALCSVKESDLDAFERYMSQLKAYYFDYSMLIPESATMHELLGLNLLSLLSQNKIAAFHTELERLDPALLHQNVFIKHPVVLE